MAWSDAAREAALIARRQHATGKKVAPQKWYHGGPQYKGDHVLVARTTRTYATSAFKFARTYREDNAKRGGNVYLVRPSSIERIVPAITTMMRRYVGTEIRSTQPMQILKRLPRAKGRASRGKY